MPIQPNPQDECCGEPVVRCGPFGRETEGLLLPEGSDLYMDLQLDACALSYCFANWHGPQVRELALCKWNGHDCCYRCPLGALVAESVGADIPWNGVV